MSKYIQSFKRYEKKYLLSSEQYERFMEAAADIIRPDDYGDTAICSIYLDTEDYRFIRESLEGPVYKEKLRIRSYGVPPEGADVFFEIKKKFNGIVYKRRITVKEPQAEAYCRGGAVPEDIAAADRQIFSEIDYIMKKCSPAPPTPRVFVGYDRIACEGTDDPSLRVTFDRNIRSRTDDLRLPYGDGGRLLRVNIPGGGGIYPDGGYRLMEIKTGSAIPVKLAEIMSGLKIYPTSFSKYGEIYKQIILPDIAARYGEKGKSAVC